MFIFDISLFAKDHILIIYSGGDIFQNTISGISEELDNDFCIDKLMIKTAEKDTTLEKIIKQKNPKALVLLDNQAISLYKKYQMAFPDSLMIPSISLMAVSVNSAIQNMKNAKGISYEVPIVYISCKSPSCS